MTETYILGLDLDGVVFNYTDALRKVAMRELGLPESSFPDPEFYSLVKSGWPFESEDHFREVHRRGVDSDMFLHAEVYPNAAEALWQLSDEGIHIRVITHRFINKGSHAAAASQTVAALENANIPYRDLCIIAAKDSVGVDALIDDSPYNITDVTAAGTPVFVFDQQYNRAFPDLPRLHGWTDETVDKILAHRDAVLAG